MTTNKPQRELISPNLEGKVEQLAEVLEQVKTTDDFAYVIEVAAQSYRKNNPEQSALWQSLLLAQEFRKGTLGKTSPYQPRKMPRTERKLPSRNGKGPYQA